MIKLYKCSNCEFFIPCDPTLSYGNNLKFCLRSNDNIIFEVTNHQYYVTNCILEIEDEKEEI